MLLLANIFQVQCRVCQKEVLRQNYKDHLKAHPGEDWRNTRVHGQPDNTKCFLLKASTGHSVHGVQKGGPSTVREQERDRERRGERDVEVRSRSRSRSPVLANHSETDLTLRRDAVDDGSSDEEEEDSDDDEFDGFDMEKGWLWSKERVNQEMENLLEEPWEVCRRKLSIASQNCFGAKRSNILQMAALLSSFREMLSCKTGREEEKAEVVPLLKRILRYLGEPAVVWTEMKLWEAEVLKQLVEDEALCPDIPPFLRNSYLCLLKGVKSNVGENPKVDENSNSQSNEGMKSVNKELDLVVKKMAAVEVDLSECQREEEAALKRISFLKKTVDVAKQIEGLVGAVNSMKEMTGLLGEAKEPIRVSREDALAKCRSLMEITQLPEFRYGESEGAIICDLCGTAFKYSTDLQRDFTDQKMSREMINLKKSLKRHVATQGHQEKVKKATTDGVVWEREEARDRAVGLHNSRIAYHLLHSGRPDTDFPLHIFINRANGADVGDINHSQNYVPKFLVHCAEAVRARVKKFLNSRLVATSCKPPVNLIMDKFTHQHHTHQLVGGVTIVPDSPQLIQALYFSSPR